jgi:hypothetical protein
MLTTPMKAPLIPAADAGQEEYLQRVLEMISDDPPISIMLIEQPT